MAAAQGAANYVHLNYGQDKEKIQTFIEKFTAPVQPNENGKGKKSRNRRGKNAAAGDDLIHPKYLDQLKASPVYYVVTQKQITEKLSGSLTIELDDVATFYPDDEEFVRNLECNTKRYLTLFSEVIDEIMPLADHVPRSGRKASSVREIRPEAVGRLVTVRGMVTRVSNVKPLAVVLLYSCDKCGSEIFQEVTGHQVNPLVTCPTDSCKKNQTKGRLHMQTRASKFLKFQEVKIQEMTDQVPMGHIPRTMTVHMFEDMTRVVNPGDAVEVSGIFLPIPYTGFKALRAGLLTDTYLEAQHVVHLKKQYNQLEITPELMAQVQTISTDEDSYDRLAHSIAPEIYGHEDVKKALLLLLVGSPTKDTGDGMKIRGDLNICLMGDPGVAKSQLLKHISKIAPRSVYTTGRGSSGVGLTASVMRDPVTDEMVLEGGALVLADNGIACIDEFDKMDESDRTAIHEVMEQQTISVSKAGITTTLNARTSILAAANPLYGRYDTRKSATANINLPAALLSRFDLLFLILDKPDMDVDLRLAHHVAHVHIHNTHPTQTNGLEPIPMNVMRHYIALARAQRPTVPKHVGDKLVDTYVRWRKDKNETADFQYTCARTLLSLVRLSSALARLRFSEEVEISDVSEAERLIEVSKASLETDKAKWSDPKDMIYDMIIDMFRDARHYGEEEELDYSEMREKVINKGYSEEQLRSCIHFYQNISVWTLMANGRKLRLTEVESD
ncbi:Mcm2-7 hexameric complex component [Quaeritorhiza haematococci]|nr:Mcm2-7 hexameric complex component [Quaeritorhiza haematococci]